MDNYLCPRGHEHGVGDAPVSFTENDIDALMAYCASIGATRHEWVIGPGQAFYHDDLLGLGYDLLDVACRKAHRHGMRFDVVFKPFEGGWYGHGTAGKLPLTFPRPEGTSFIEELDGLIHGVDPFIAEHPEMRLERDPSDLADPGGPVSTIRLVRRGKDETGITADNITISTSCDGTGRNIEKYQGPIHCTETMEYRPQLHYREQSFRIVNIDGLQLPEKATHIIIGFNTEHELNFENHICNIVEIANKKGKLIPALPAPGPFGTQEKSKILRRAPGRSPNHYLRHPEVRHIIEDESLFNEHLLTANRLRSKCVGDNPTRIRLKAGEGHELVIMRGKPRYNDSVLNPVYPEVRTHWLDWIRFCIERGVDGVNIRAQCHNFAYDPWLFGFNPPTRSQMIHAGNFAEASVVNGRAYTQFLGDAASLLHAAGREMGIHVYTTVLGIGTEDYGAWYINLLRDIPFEWDWKTWIREIADYVEFRGAFTMRPENIKRAVDTIGIIAREAGKKFIYQSSRAADVVSFDGAHNHLSWEIDKIVSPHPDIDIYNIYETACFTRFNELGAFEGSRQVEKLVKRL